MTAMTAPIAWLDPRNLDDALDALSATSLAKAGGVDLFDRLKEGLDTPTRLVNLRAIPGLDGLTEAETGLRVGPLVTLAQIAESPLVQQRFAALAEAAGHAATPNVRNAATVGGNLLQRPRCWYFRSDQFPCRKKGGSICFAQQGENDYHAIFDNGLCAIVHPSAAAVALVALEAKVEIARRTGEGARRKTERREIPIADLFVPPERELHREHVLEADELLTEIRVPTPRPGARSAYAKLGEKESFDWPIAEVAVALEFDGPVVRSARIVLGAAAPVPRRAGKAEKLLIGKTLDETTARAAAKVAVEGATPLANNGHRVTILETLVRRTLLAAKDVA